MPNRKKSKIPYISLFSGAMGLDLGLEQAGFYPIVCNDNDSAAIGTIHANRPNVRTIEKSISNISVEDLCASAGQDVREIPLIAGGPPCQAFSVFGRRKGILDERGQLIFEFHRLVNEVRPKMFIMENVRGLLSMSILPASAVRSIKDVEDMCKFEKGSLIKKVFKEFEKIGYRIDCFVVNSVNYGAPQIRERLMLIGNRYDLVAEFPQPQYSNRRSDALPPFKTLGDIIGPGFEDPDKDVMNFSPRKLKYLAMIPPGGNWRSLPVNIQKESMGKSWYLKGGRSAYWRKLSFTFPCPTLVTMPNHAGTSMCHPKELRALTVGEMAAIQEFPTHPKPWKFVGSPIDKCRLIGNAVPVRLGAVAGKVLRELLTKTEKINNVKKRRVYGVSRVVHLRPHVRTRSFWRNGNALAGDHGYYGNIDKSREEPDLFSNLTKESSV